MYMKNVETLDTTMENGDRAASRQKRILKVDLVNVYKCIGPHSYICLGPPIH